MKHVVIDTCVLTSGLRSQNGASFAVLRLVAARLVRPLVSVALFLEYESVPKRPEQMAALLLTATEVDRMLAEFAALAAPVDLHFLWRPQLGDPGDELVLEAAINGRAEALVTHNGRDFLPAARFGLPVLTPARFLEGFRS